MSRWFRFYSAAVNDPKVQRLPAPLFKTWINILCVASEHDGKIPSLSDLAFALRTSDTALGEDFDALVAAGLIDEFDDGGASPHNWANRQFQSDQSNERVKRHRDKNRNVTTTVTVTPPDTDTDTDTDQTKQTEGARKRATRLPVDYEPDISVALSLGLSRQQAETEAPKFRDHFAAAPGQRGVKNDWPATWRNWCRRSLETNGTQHGRPGKYSAGNGSSSNPVFRAVATAFAARNGGDQWPTGDDVGHGAERAGAGGDTGPVIDLEAAVARRA